MAPEAFEGVLNDPRSDLYSIGCCLFLYVARHFHMGRVVAEQSFANSTETPPSPSLLISR